MSLSDCWQKVKQHQDELWIILAAMLGLGLVLGLWQWRAGAQAKVPLQIENVPAAVDNLATIHTSTSRVGEPASAPATAGKGKYVASKNGTRYYLPSCAGVKRIKEENKIWFATVEAARARGLAPAANCPGL